MPTRDQIPAPPESYKHPALQLWSRIDLFGREVGISAILTVDAIDNAAFDIVEHTEQELARRIAEKVGRPGDAAAVTCEWGWVDLVPIEEAADATG
jgi:hypothetical protein